MNFTKADLKQAFSSTYFARGQAYFRQGMVLDVDVYEQARSIVSFTAEVEGSFEPYTQDITIEQKSSMSPLGVKGYCSCPVGYNCKHVVAACLHCQEEFEQMPLSPDAPDQQSLAWLEAFSKSFQRVETVPAANEKFLVYVLDIDSAKQRLKVELCLTNVMKRGGLSKGKRVHFRELCYYPPSYAKTVDVEVAKLLEASADGYGYSSVNHIQGKAGFLALKQMLATGRCYWGNHQTQQVLVEGEARAFACQWAYDKQGSAELEIVITPDAIILATDPPMYWDASNHEIGVLNNVPYSASQLEMLIQAPAVPASLVDEFSQRTALSLPEHVLAPPKSIETKVIKNEEPIPQLLLQLKEHQGSAYRCARLQFSYAEYDVPAFPPDDEIRLVEEHKIVTICRDMEEEDSFIGALQGFAFDVGEWAGEQECYFFFNEKNEVANDTLWANFISNGIPVLEAEGWTIEIADNFDMQLHEVDQWHADIEEQGNDWFALRFDIEINQQKQPLLPLITQVLEHYELDDLPETLLMNLGGGQYVQLPSEQIKPMLDILYELYDRDSLSQDGALELSRFDAVRVADLELQHSNLQWCGGEQLRLIGKQLKNFDGIQPVEPPQGLQAELRGYQQQGLNWLQFLRSYHLNGILADDMGLGKTVQALAHLLLEKEQGRLDKPCLIIAPTSLMGNWRREAAVFAPALSVLTLQGSERQQHFECIADYDIVLSTYPLLVRDDEVLLQHEYHLLILDEAQVVKNPKSKAAKVIRQFHAAHKLCLTGTPMENHLGELWALFDFLMPGFLGDAKQFNSLFRKPIENQGNRALQQRLVERVKPFMLRRTKAAVASELPEKTEITRMIRLGKQQATLYESIRISMEDKVRKTIATKGLARSHITILDALLKLRQVCCDPRILSLKQASKVNESAKLDHLMEMLPNLVEEGRRILIFSQFTKMLALIEQQVKAHKISYTKLTGQTRKRDEVIERFKQGKADVFLISLKAGGVGLNLTQADTVIHYDPWWNPAAENQATDRAHRIGQDKAVFVYKLVVENSVEEKIIAMQDKKKALADAMYQQGAKKDELTISSDDMQALFTPLA
ncbi:MAG: SNF2-related protein [Mariprofundus sp.]|nr:SNF2-related protein [Mariprofundus sp.]